MRLRVLSRADVERALDPDALVEALAAAFARLSAGEASMPPRIGVDVPGRGTVLLMGAHVHGAPSLAVKLVSLFPGAIPAHRAVVVVLDAATGAATAIMDGDAVTALRTAAASRLATRLLAREDARVLAVVGTGVQGAAHVRALLRERVWDEVRLAGRRAEAAEALAAELGAPVRAVASAEEALRGAGVVCVATPATEPVLRRAWLDDGAHVNSVGFSTAGGELDPDIVADALVVVEARASALAPAPAGSRDLLGVAAPEAVAELGEIVSGAHPGRTSAVQLTLFKSVGVGIEDDVAAALALASAEAQGLGATVEL